MRRIIYLLRRIYFYAVYGRNLYVHGRFEVVNRKNVKFGDGCSVNYGVFILGQSEITIGDGVVLSANSMLIDSGLDLGDEHRKHTDGSISIRDGAWIGAGAIILPNVTVGKNSVVGAGSVVTKDVPDGAVVAGNPARLIRYI